MFNKNGSFKKGKIAELSIQYGIDPNSMNTKNLLKEIYKKIHGY